MLGSNKIFAPNLGHSIQTKHRLSVIVLIFCSATLEIQIHHVGMVQSIALTLIMCYQQKILVLLFQPILLNFMHMFGSNIAHQVAKDYQYHVIHFLNIDKIGLES